MKKRILFSATALIFALATFAQKPDIKFNEMNHDFGTVAEEQGKITHVFEFTNTGTSDLILSNVQASCGCTTPQWSRDPIAPKGTGTITVTYNTTGRPGPFTKTITITSNADKRVLIIKGNVTPKGKKVEEVYPIVVGDVRIKTESVNFGDVAYGEKNTEQFSLANTSDKDIKVSLTGLPKYITTESKVLKAGEKANISVSFDAAMAKKWGLVNNKVKLVVTKDKVATEHEIITLASIYEKFSEEQKANAPVVDVVREINVGDITVGSKKTVKIAIKNTGKSDLLIRNASSSYTDLKIKAPKSVKPGQSAEIKVTIDAKKAIVNNYSKYINLQLNDPSNAKRTIAVVYKVVEAKK